MKKHTPPAALLATAAVALLGAGCATIENPMTVPQGPKDSAIYEAGKRKTERKDEKKFTVDVFVEADNARLSKTIDGYLRSKLGKFPFFKVSTADTTAARVHARRMTKAVESGEEADTSIPRSDAQYTILAVVNSAETHGDGGIANASTVAGAGMGVAGVGSMAGSQGSPTGMGTGATLLAAGAATAALGNGLEPGVVEMSINFEFYDNVHDETISSENVIRQVSGLSKSSVSSETLSAARACVDEYVAILSRDYLQEARVLETRGDGKYAWISLGQKDGVVADTKVQFYEIDDLGDVMDSWSVTQKPIAYGTVIGVPDGKTCWAKIEQYDKVSVRKYHFVKIISIPKPKSSVLERVGISL